MRRMAVCLLALLLIMGTAFAAVGLSAGEIAFAMAKRVTEMQDVREAPLGNMADRAIWTDRRTDSKCALTVFADASAAAEAAVELGTRYTAVRKVDCCLLEIDSDLSAEVIDAYRQALADVLGMEISEEAPDYILNVNTKKFHDPECSSVREMKESNRQPYTGAKEMLEEKGYEACKRCKP